MKKKHYIYIVAQYSYILLWGYASVHQLSNVDRTRLAMAEQPFPEWMADILWWLLPAMHVILILMLLYRPWIRVGMKWSTLLLTAYSFYLVLGVARVFGSTPCICAGIWPSNDHWLHIILNSLFLILGIYYWVLAHRSRTTGDVLSDFGREEGIIGT